MTDTGHITITQKANTVTAMGAQKFYINKFSLLPAIIAPYGILGIVHVHFLPTEK